MNPRLRTFVMGTVVVGAVATSTISRAQSADEAAKRTEEARARFQRGVELYKDGDYRASLIEFRRAYELVENWRIHYNIAQACGELQDYPCALRELEAYVATGGSEIPEERRAAVLAELRRVRGRIGHVTIRVNRPDAEVFVDDQSLGGAPINGPAVLGTGRHRIVARLPNGQTAVKVVDLAGSDQISVALEFVDVTRATAVTEKPAQQTSGSSGMAPVYVGLGVTGAFVAGAAVTGVLALGAQRDLEKSLAIVPGSATEIDDNRSRARALALVTDVLGGVAIVAAGVTVYFFATKTPAPAQAARVGVALGPRGVGLSGRF